MCLMDSNLDILIPGISLRTELTQSPFVIVYIFYHIASEQRLSQS